MDPYTTLNVPDGADDAAIRAAYRKLAQKHHPDKGGDLHAFRDIQKAYDLIGTAEAREYFSLHGAEAPPFGQVESEALGQIASIFAVWLDAQFNGKPVVANPLEHVRMNLNSEIQAIDKAKHQVQKSLDKAHRLQGRFSTNGEVNVFEVRLNDVCEQAEKNLSEIAKAEERARTALALLAAFSYTPEAGMQAPIQSFYIGTGSTTTGW